MPTNTPEETALVQLNTSLEAANWRAERESVLARGKTVTQVTNADELEVATKIAKEAKALVKALANERLKLTRPLDAMKKAFTELEKKEAKDLDKLSIALDDMASRYALEQARKAEEERRRIEAIERARAEAELAARAEAEARERAAAEAAAAFGMGAPATPAPAPAPVPPPAVLTPVPTVQKASSASASFVEKWKFSIQDPNMVPRELCSPDHTKINAFLMAKKAEGYKPEQLSVPGIGIYLDVQVRAR